jgi:hypothetical protein
MKSSTITDPQPRPPVPILLACGKIAPALFRECLDIEAIVSDWVFAFFFEGID